MSTFEPLIRHTGLASTRRWEERRQGGDRRCGRDRRLSSAPQTLNLEPRPYGFRAFSERRNRQDRRIYGPDSYGADGESGDRRADTAPFDRDSLRSLLTEEEIRYLLRSGRRGRR